MNQGVFTLRWTCLQCAQYDQKALPRLTAEEYMFDCVSAAIVHFLLALTQSSICCIGLLGEMMYTVCSNHVHHFTRHSLVTIETWQTLSIATTITKVCDWPYTVLQRDFEGGFLLIFDESGQIMWSIWSDSPTVVICVCVDALQISFVAQRRVVSSLTPWCTYRGLLELDTDVPTKMVGINWKFGNEILFQSSPIMFTLKRETDHFLPFLFLCSFILLSKLAVV